MIKADVQSASVGYGKIRRRTDRADHVTKSFTFTTDSVLSIAHARGKTPMLNWGSRDRQQCRIAILDIRLPANAVPTRENDRTGASEMGSSAACAPRPLGPKIIRASEPFGSWWRVSLRLGGRRVHGTGLATITSAFIALGLTTAEPRDFKAADTQSHDHPTARALVHMSELVSDRTQGRHRMIVYPEGVLGEQGATFEQTRTGGIDINRTNMAPFASFVGKENIFGLPFLFRSADHLHRVLDGPIGDDILQSLEPHGFVGLAFFESGARSLYTVRRPVRTIDDIKGLRIRLQQSDLMAQMFTALGAEPVILPYTRTKTALMAGLIDAAENNWPSYVASDHYSVAPHFALTEHT